MQEHQPIHWLLSLSLYKDLVLTAMILPQCPSLSPLNEAQQCPLVVVERDVNGALSSQNHDSFTTRRKHKDSSWIEIWAQ